MDLPVITFTAGDTETVVAPPGLGDLAGWLASLTIKKRREVQSDADAVFYADVEPEAGEEAVAFFLSPTVTRDLRDTRTDLVMDVQLVSPGGERVLSYPRMAVEVVPDVTTRTQPLDL